ncbi:TIGR03621 family F420-dependent LLM class oxidoreductase [Saccharothrix obliqua]|uniref:TIGR03621 family F420-dependent LLM class oxidoreductase n=1 Tax=Saccharothrix obliqua TaxID=2861747 RepID=UPI001C5FB123|nr:TIGR03621 family F420-dependent LLM class oxidoreductase [Saccharothrix obliqua]MBW4718298.1 TIGR03621 family F420-dependent LLM class oxidoreductase [Saccharothrix obliqua]
MSDVPERPFRFGICLFTPVERDDWVKKVKLAEELGFDVVSVSDHLGMPAPLPTLVLAAEATERIRIGTLVLNTTFYQPTVLARDIATIDRYAGGRVEVGLGAGYDRSQFDAAGLPWTSAAERVAHLERTVDRLKAEPGPPVMIAGRGDRVLRLAAEKADVIAFTGTTRVRRDGDGLRLGGLAEISDRVEFVRGLLGPRAGQVELNIPIHRVLPPGGGHGVTDVWQNDLDLTTDQLVELPSVLVGTPEECAEQLYAARQRFGISYFSVLEPEMSAFARVIEVLR